jgi:hypothetical protein
MSSIIRCRSSLMMASLPGIAGTDHHPPALQCAQAFANLLRLALFSERRTA